MLLLYLAAMSNITVNVNSSEPFTITIALPVRFCLMLIVEIPSLFCTLFLLYHLIFGRPLRLALKNHVTIVVLILTLLYELINIPANWNHYRTTKIWPPSPGICLTIWMIGFGGHNTCEILVAWALVERHILTFYHQLLNTRTVSISFDSLNCFFYIKAILFSDCENQFFYNSIACGAFPCYQADHFLAMWDVFVNSSIPTLLIGLFRLALLLRAIIQKGSLGRQQEWGRYRKMITQLLSLATFPFSHQCSSSSSNSLLIQPGATISDLFSISQLIFCFKCSTKCFSKTYFQTKKTNYRTISYSTCYQCSYRLHK
jgi:hypothetical protein